MTTARKGIVLALSGGIGGAKLVLGLSHVVGAGQLVVVANTGDDFEHLGLRISPDIDTLLYTLAGLSNTDTGWGRAAESWHFMEEIERLGGQTWFRLGDKDVALHVERTHRLRAGETLSEITGDVAERLGVQATILPMSDDPVRTRVRTPAGWIAFQDYFVRQRCEAVVLELAFAGATAAHPHPQFLELLGHPGLRAVVICPSNPFISIDPILAVPDVRAALARCTAPVVAVSPIIGGAAVKGPTAKIMSELGIKASACSVAERYADLIDVFVADSTDAPALETLDDRTGIGVVLTQAHMITLDDRIALAEVVLAAADNALRSEGWRA